MEDFTHHNQYAPRDKVVEAILNHIHAAFRIADVQDCINVEEYKIMKRIKEEVEELFSKDK